MRKSQTGFSIVELIVAALIALIGSIVIFQVFSVFEGQKRATTGGGDAQSALVLAMHIMERDVRQAGFGIADQNFYGCTINGWDTSDFTQTFLPAEIVQGANASTPDTLTLFYGSSQLAHFPPALAQNMASNVSDYRVSNRHGFELGDILIVAGAIAGAPNCTLAQVTALPTASGVTDTISHTNGGANGRFNKSGGLGPSYPATTTKIFNLGRTPVVNTYSVSNGQLRVQAFRDAAATPVVDGIVQLQVRYGVDTGTDNIVDVYQDAVPTDWSKVLTIRLALAARVSQYEKEEVSPATIPMWSGGPVWTLTADERHYRYRVIDTIVPLRNMIWKRAS